LPLPLFPKVQSQNSPSLFHLSLYSQVLGELCFPARHKYLPSLPFFAISVLLAASVLHKQLLSLASRLSSNLQSSQHHSRSASPEFSGEFYLRQQVFLSPWSCHLSQALISFILATILALTSALPAANRASSSNFHERFLDYFLVCTNQSAISASTCWDRYRTQWYFPQPPLPLSLSHLTTLPAWIPAA
jgi:hypothetical protein